MKFNCSYKEILDASSLKPNPKNPNKHSKDQIERLAKIIEYQGQRSPIVVSNQSGFITKGHGRLEAMKNLGWKIVAVDFQDYDSDEQEYADIVADNSIAEWSELDFSMINSDLTDLGPDFDIDLLGIENFRIDPFDDEEKEMNQKIQDDMNKKFIIEVTFPNDMEMMDIHDDLVSRGYIVKIKDFKNV